MSGALNEQLQRLVLTSTMVDEPTRDDLQTLQRYFEDPSTVNLACGALLDRAVASDDVDTHGRVLKIVRTFLVQYVPSRDTLDRLDAFCKKLTARTESESLVTSANLLRTLIAKHIRRTSDPDPSKDVSASNGALGGSSPLMAARTPFNETTPSPTISEAPEPVDLGDDPFDDLPEPEFIVHNLLRERPRVFAAEEARTLPLMVLYFYCADGAV